MKDLKFLLVVLCCPLTVFCQDLSGLWTGTISNDSTGQTFQYEVGIKKEKGKYTGFSHTWFVIEGKKYYGIKKVKVRIADDHKIIILDEELVANNYPVSPNKNVRQLNVLDFQVSNSGVVLEGLFVTNKTKEFSPLTGHVSIKKNNDFMQSDLSMYLEKLGIGKEWSLVTASNETVAKNE